MKKKPTPASKAPVILVVLVIIAIAGFLLVYHKNTISIDNQTEQAKLLKSMNSELKDPDQNDPTQQQLEDLYDSQAGSHQINFITYFKSFASDSTTKDIKTNLDTAASSIQAEIDSLANGSGKTLLNGAQSSIRIANQQLAQNNLLGAKRATIRAQSRVIASQVKSSNIDNAKRYLRLAKAALTSLIATSNSNSSVSTGNNQTTTSASPAARQDSQPDCSKAINTYCEARKARAQARYCFNTGGNSPALKKYQTACSTIRNTGNRNCLVTGQKGFKADCISNFNCNSITDPQARASCIGNKEQACQTQLEDKCFSENTENPDGTGRTCQQLVDQAAEDRASFQQSARGFSCGIDATAIPDFDDRCLGKGQTIAQIDCSKYAAFTLSGVVNDCTEVCK